MTFYSYIPNNTSQDQLGSLTTHLQEEYEENQLFKSFIFTKT